MFCPWPQFTYSLIAVYDFFPTDSERAGYYFGLSGLGDIFVRVTRGDALRACPWLSYSAPLALCSAPLALCSEFFVQSQLGVWSDK